MDSDQNNTPSSEDAEIEPIPAHMVEVNEQTTDIENDYRINCTDIRSLRNILDITLNEIESFADAFNLKDNRSDFLSVFSESFKNALQENINVNGLPLKMDENVKLSSAEREDHLHMVDDVLFSKLSKKVATVARERKFCPEQCRRIKCIEMKHEQQNLDTAENRKAGISFYKSNFKPT